AIVFVRPRFRIDAGRPHRSDRVNDVVRPQSSGDDHRNIHVLYDCSIDLPAAGHAERPDLHVAGPMAVQQQHVGNAIVAPGDGDAFVTGTLRIRAQPPQRVLSPCAMAGVSRSVDAPRWRIEGFNCATICSMSRRSAESGSATPLHGGGMAENMIRARSIDCSRGNEPSPTRTPIWSTPSSASARASSELEIS